MINKLLKHYKDALLVSETPVQEDKYNWFSSDDGTLFGIEKDKITVEEQQLLSTLFLHLDTNEMTMTEEQSVWYQFLFQNKDTVTHLYSSYSQCRFIHFQTSKPISDSADFEIAVKALFPYETNMIWVDESNGIIIETSNGEKNDQVQIDEMIDTLTSDFYVDIYFYVGQTYPFTKEVRDSFSWERICFQKAFQYLHKQKVTRIYNILPYLMLEKIDPFLSEKLTKTILQEYKNDIELLETIKVYLESNLNVSLAAKKLYMHRNSLQYRIDKFIEKTGIDIKHFQGAMTTYLAIINTEQFSVDHD